MDLQSAFDSTCKVVFGRQLGTLSEFGPYLSEMMTPYSVEKSCLSGKDVMVASTMYPAGARFISQDEMGRLEFPPLSTNEIKDIDSLFAAVSERAVYCGNKVFGKCHGLSSVDNCVDCTSVSHSHNVRGVKYGAYLAHQRDSEFVFGTMGFPKSYSSIRCYWGVGAARCFESYYSTNLTETYYAFNCIGCSQCMFAFNLRSKRYAIGNLELERGRYLELKDKLVSEMADELARRKKLLSIADIAWLGRDENDAPEEKSVPDSPVPKRVEQAFAETTRLVLGKERAGLREYGPWLLRRATRVRRLKGAFGSPVYRPDGLPVISRLPADRLVTLEEGMKASRERPIRIAPSELPGLQEILRRVSQAAYFTIEFVDGQNENCVDTPSVFSGSNVYKMLDTTGAKYSAYSTCAVNSEHIFGGYLRLLDCQFCINCYDSVNIKGCLEVDASYACRNCYFCHNCENVSDSMFCFNARSLQYAVGNAVVGKEEFLRLKKMLLDYVNSELDAKRALGEEIFCIPPAASGAKSRKSP